MNPENKTEKKERILYVDRSSLIDSSGYKALACITKSLRKKYSLDIYETLDAGVIDLAREELSARKISAFNSRYSFTLDFDWFARN